MHGEDNEYYDLEDKAVCAECLRRVAASGCNCDRGYKKYCDDVIRWVDA
ncbi:MAG: hypothetical protein RR178_05160 [Gordonibacter sp.]